MSVFIDPKTGEPREDRRGTIDENSLENKVGFALGKLITDIKSIREIIDTNKQHTDSRFNDFREALKGSFDELEEHIEKYFKELEKDLKEELFDSLKKNEKQHRYFINSIKNHQARITSLEKRPLDKAVKIMGFSSDLFWKVITPILVAVVTALLVGLL